MLRTRLMIVALLVGIVFGLGLLIGVILPRLTGWGQTPPSSLSTATILRQVQTLSQLVTIKYVMEKVVVLEDVKWYGESRVLMIAHGIVKAGVDLEQMGPDDLKLSPDGKKITLRLPMPVITDAYLDDKKTQVVERSTGVLRTFDKNLEQTARVQAVDDIRRSARYSGILQDAEQRAKDQLRFFFSQMGIAEIVVTAKP